MSPLCSSAGRSEGHPTSAGTIGTAARSLDWWIVYRVFSPNQLRELAMQHMLGVCVAERVQAQIALAYILPNASGMNVHGQAS